MSPFSAANIARTIEQVPGRGTKQLRVLLERAQAKQIVSLIDAVKAELELREAVELDEKSAQQHLVWAESVTGLDLVRTIDMAFRACPMRREEFMLTQLIASTPGIRYDALEKAHGKRDVALILGHMVYERLGFFRRFLEGQKRMSDLLFRRTDVAGRVTYSLTDEAEAAFNAMDLIGLILELPKVRALIVKTVVVNSVQILTKV